MFVIQYMDHNEGGEECLWKNIEQLKGSSGLEPVSSKLFSLSFRRAIASPLILAT